MKPRTIRPTALSALHDHVVDIFFGCTSKQMLWIHTPFVVALMADIQAFWNRAKVQFVRESVRRDARATDTQLPVAVRPNTGSPPPAIVCFFHTRPEPFDAVVAPAVLELRAACRRIWHSSVMTLREACGHMGGRDGRDHRAASAFARDARHREDFGAVGFLGFDLVGASLHVVMIPLNQ